MKKLITLIIIYSVVLFWVNSLAQVRSEKVVVKKIANNTYRLKAKLIGNFNQISKLADSTNKGILNFLLANYDIGFYFENYRELDWNTGAKPIGKVIKFVDANPDTLVFSTTITNPTKQKEYVCKTFFAPKNNKYLFVPSDSVQVGTKLQDKICKPNIISITKDKRFYAVGDTATITVNLERETFCSGAFTYKWEFATYDISKIDTVSYVQSDTAGKIGSIVVEDIDTTYQYSAWKKWTNKRAGFISMKDATIIFEIRNKKWNLRKWRCLVSNNIGKDKSKAIKIRVK